MRKSLLMAVLATMACASDPETSDVQQQSRACTGDTGRVVKCDGISDQAAANSFCDLVCTSEGGGYCFRPNPADLFHGTCVVGQIP